MTKRTEKKVVKKYCLAVRGSRGKPNTYKEVNGGLANWNQKQEKKKKSKRKKARRRLKKEHGKGMTLGKGGNLH